MKKVKSIAVAQVSENTIACVIQEPSGRAHIGFAKCNLKAGDKFSFAEGRKHATRRALYAMRTGDTAYFKPKCPGDVQIMFKADVHVVTDFTVRL